MAWRLTTLLSRPSTHTFSTLITRHSPFEMTMQDPFDRVLTRFGVYQYIKDMEPIPTAAVPVTSNNTLEAPCRVQWQISRSNMSDDVRMTLATKFIKYVHLPIRGATQIRPISLIVDLNGTVQTEPIHMLVSSPDVHYPARYRIPPSMIEGLQPGERIWRSEKFALGTLLYELYTDQTIFDGQSDDEVQEQYRRAATFPNLESLPALMQCLIYACWSAEFGHYISLSTFTRYVEDNRVRLALQALGTVVSIAAVVPGPILCAIGFSVLGPVAGSVAAGWQASIGAVGAGSLFSFFQSVAMGGAAASGLATAGVGGAAVTLAATGFPSPSNLRVAFIRRFREGPGT